MYIKFTFIIFVPPREILYKWYNSHPIDGECCILLYKLPHRVSVSKEKPNIINSVLCFYFAKLSELADCLRMNRLIELKPLWVFM